MPRAAARMECMLIAHLIASLIRGFFGLSSASIQTRRGWAAVRFQRRLPLREQSTGGLPNRCRSPSTSRPRTLTAPKSPRRGQRMPPIASLRASVIASLIRYFDYPKAPSRVFAVLPAVKIAVLLREPVSRAVSAFNVRWLTWLCG